MSTSTIQGHTGKSCFSSISLSFYQNLQGFLHATGDPMTKDHRYSDHPSRYVSSYPWIKPGLTAPQVSILPTRSLMGVTDIISLNINIIS